MHPQRFPDALGRQWVDSGIFRLRLIPISIWVVWGVAMLSGCLGGNEAPLITPVSDQTALAGTLFELTLFVRDPDGDALSYKVEGAPATAEAFVVPEGLHFRWAPLPSEVAPGGRSYYIAVHAIDAQGADTELRFVIIAFPDGGTPVFISPPGYVLDLARTDRISFTVEVKDDDSAQIQITVIQDLPGAQWTLLDDRSRSVTWIPSPDQIAERKYWSLILSAQDETHGMVVQTISVVFSNAHVFRDCPGSWPWVEEFSFLPAAGGGVDIWVKAQDPESAVQRAAFVWTSFDLSGQEVRFGTHPLFPLGDGEFSGSLSGFEMGAPIAVVLDGAVRIGDDDDVDSSLCDHETRFPKRSYRSLQLDGVSCPSEGGAPGGEAGDLLAGSVVSGELYRTRLCAGVPRIFSAPVSQAAALALVVQSSEESSIRVELSGAEPGVVLESVVGSGSLVIHRYPMGDPGPARISLSTSEPSGIVVAEFLAAITANACDPDPFEPDNNLDQAPLKGQAVAESRVLCPGDQDFLKITLANSALLQVHASFDYQDGDLDIHVLADDGKTMVRLAQSRSEDEILDTALPAGSYYLRITAGTPTGAIPYILDMSLQPQSACFDDVFSPNGAVSEAKLLPETTLEDLIVCPGKSDHFAHVINQSESYHVVASSTGGLEALDVALLSESGAVVQSAAKVLDTSSLDEGRYILRVRTDALEPVSYSLEFSVDSHGDPCADRFGANDSAQLAPLLVEGWTTRIALCAGDLDYFGVRTSGPQQVRVLIDYPSPAEPLQLDYIGAAGQVLASAANQGNYGVLDTALPTAATHIFRVGPGAGQVHYDLRVEFP